VKSRYSPSPFEWGAWAGWVGVVAWTYAGRFSLPGATYVGTFSDDFFYYLVPARNWLEHGAPSFDGVTPTNGFQPLWFLCVLASSLVAGKGSAVFALVTAASVVLLALSVLELRRISIGIDVDARLATAVAIAFGTYAAYYADGGMETALAVYLCSVTTRLLLEAPLSAQSRRRRLLSGFAASLMLLCRLDSVMLLVVWIALTPLVTRPSKVSLAAAGQFCLGGVLLPIYLGVNRLFFHGWLPQSISAKRLKTSWIPAWSDLRLQFFDRQSLLLYLGILAALVVVWKSGKVRAENRPILSAGLLLPLVTIAAHFWVSGWEMLDWYRYPVPIAGTISWSVLLLLCPASWIAERRVRLGMAVALAGFFVVRFVLSPNAKPRVREPYNEAVELARFARAHPGTYAMGDRAGVFAYLGGRRVIQTEGLVMDPTFLRNIGEERNLVDVLRQHGVRYFVSTVSHSHPLPRDASGCLVVFEPAMRVAAAHSARMTGRFCQPPIHSFTSSYGDVRVFDVEAESRAASQ
jgi:hypothetical protein